MTSTQVSTRTTGATAVALPHRDPTMSASSPNRPPPVWSLESNGTLTPPLTEKCDRHDRQDGVCCKELKGEDDRILIDPDVIRDM